MKNYNIHALNVLWIAKPLLLTSMRIEVSSVLNVLDFGWSLAINKGGAHESKVSVSNRRIPM